MRFFKPLLALSLLFVVALSSVSAVDTNNTPQSLAQYAPADSEIFVTFRVDAEYVGTLEELVNSVINKLPESVPAMPISLVEQLDQTLSEVELTYDGFLEIIDGHAGVTVSNFEVLADSDFSNDDEAVPMLIAPLNSVAALEAWMAEQLPADAVYTEVDGWNVVAPEEGRGGLVYNDDVVYLQVNGTPTAPIFTEFLADSESFISTVNALPADQYNVVAYLDGAALMQLSSANLPEEQAQAMMASMPQIGQMAMGMTILDGRTLTIDAAQVNFDPSLLDGFEPLNLDLLGFVPSGTMAVALGNNIDSSINQAIDQLQLQLDATMGSETNIREEINAQLANVGLTLEEDIIGWMTGHALATLDVDYSAIIDAVNATGGNAVPQFERIPVSFSVVFETTDMERAQNFMNVILDQVRSTAANDESVTVTEDTEVGGIPGTRVTLNVPFSPESPTPFSLFFTVNEGTFYIGTTDILENLASGGPSILDDAAYQQASQYFLPDTYTLAYADEDALLSFAAIPALALVGPQIGNVFDSVREQLSTEPAGRTLIQNNNPMEMVNQAYAAAQNILGSASATSQIVDDMAISRIVLTLED